MTQRYFLALCFTNRSAKSDFKVGRGGSGDADYWSEDFDNSKNCAQEKKVTKMRHEVRELNNF